MGKKTSGKGDLSFTALAVVTGLALVFFPEPSTTALGALILTGTLLGAGAKAVSK